MPGWKGSFGTLPQEPQRYFTDVWRSTDGCAWERVMENAPFGLRGYIGSAGSCSLNGRIYLLGGGTYETPAVPHRIYNNDVWSSADGIVRTPAIPPLHHHHVSCSCPQVET